MPAFVHKPDFTPTPSLGTRAQVATAGEVPDSATAVGVAVRAGSPLPDGITYSWAALEAAGFQGKAGQTRVLPSATDGAVTVLVGVGEKLGTSELRDAAAAFANAVPDHGNLAVRLGAVTGLTPAEIGQAVTEGILLSRYRYDALKTTASTIAVGMLTLVGSGGGEDLAAGAERGVATSHATMLARDLANTPPSLMTAEIMANIAVALGEERGFGVEVFDREALIGMGCGGLLGVNAGSTKEPRMIKLTYTPAGDPTGHVSLVGKGIMYDAGGLAIKPGDAVHATMKNDMSGAAAIMGAVAALGALECPTAVTAFLMCTDNVPSGSAMAMGDVLTIRGGKTVEVLNTDAEGRLVMADALVLATEEPTDAIVDIATLTGAAMRTFGTEIAAIMANDDGITAQLKAAALSSDEPVWELPLASRYRKELDSPVADIANLGGPNAGSITAGLFLEEFVDGKPWGHIDIAGVAQNNAHSGWRPAGCTGFGARLLIDFLMGFEATDQKGSGR